MSKRVRTEAERLEQVLFVGQMLSNAAYNYKQDKRLPDDVRANMAKLADQWDEAYLPHAGAAALNKHIAPFTGLRVLAEAANTCAEFMEAKDL